MDSKRATGSKRVQSSIALFCFASIVLLAGSGPAFAQDLTEARALELMTKYDDLYRGESSEGRMVMHIKTKHWERTIKMDTVTFGEDYTLVRIVSPRKEKGTATLKVKKDIYNYLPKTDRTIKITSGMMGGAWMGSHFTNDDLVQDSRYSRDFTLKITFEGERDKQKVVDVTLTPKPDAAVVWGKIVATLRLADAMPVKFDYYDEEMVLVRTMTFSDYKNEHGRLIPLRMKLIPLDKPGEFTEILRENVKYDTGIGADYFTIQRLGRKR